MTQFQRFLISMPEEMVYHLMNEPFNAELRVLRRYKKRSEETRGQKERLYLLNDDKSRMDFLDGCLRVYKAKACANERLDMLTSQNDTAAQRYMALNSLKEVVMEHNLQGYELRKQHAQDTKSAYILCEMTEVQYPTLPTPGDYGDNRPRKFRKLFAKPADWPEYYSTGNYPMKPDEYDKAKYYPNN